jgi:diaminohydroxyphosphoribosylaminopyrimidine deaminase / 5-amino-6-(5-phosphoribosylamino)uracil reductase
LKFVSADKHLIFMRLALRLARKGSGKTSPNPMVGAVLVRNGKIIGRGWHRCAGGPHAEIAALRDAQINGRSTRGATLFVTLEPCCTQGRTPPCTDALMAAGIKKVFIGATDPNPQHAGKGFEILQRAGMEIVSGVLGDEAARLNEVFNHWIVRRTPFVTVKAAMTLDGKIATASGESKWITGEKAREYGMKLRFASDAILVGINTILSDNPSLTARSQNSEFRIQNKNPQLRRIVLDSRARTPLTAKVVSDEFVALTTIVVSAHAPKKRVAELSKRVNILVAPVKKNSSRVTRHASLDLRWLLKKLGAQNVTSLLVEGGGAVNASFLLGGFAQRMAFFYAPKILGGHAARKGVAGDGVKNLKEVVTLHDIKWQRLGEDLLLTAGVIES